ncbi:MFS transporter [Nocardia sp. 2]|uniref:MFS transporter n=1 Tax=Nocardia acididurans TaxID=2802282 RepID=A0ABS1M4K9_9NOCA|nr:MFS transporter [Nocardia acididurans]MBL1075582.1 MFS transporter [Nocardia acididurans]
MTIAIERPPVENTTATTESEQTVAHRWLGLLAILAATLLNLLDATIVTVAAPAIRADLGGSVATVQWLSAGYTLAMAIGLLTGGRLGDMYGRKRVLQIGLTGFLVASMLCGLAGSIELLLIGRIAQGLFAAVMVPQCFGLIRDLFGREFGKAYAAFGPLIGIATIAGPIVAGLLVDADVLGTGWRSIFLMNLPLGLVALALGAWILPAASPLPGLKLDLRGAIVAGTGMALLLYPLVEGRELGWPWWSIAMLIASIPVLGAFAADQSRRNRAGRVALVDLGVFAKRSYTSGIVFVTVFFGGIGGFSLAVGLFLQMGLGYGALRASLTMAPWAVGAFLGSGLSAGLAPRLGRSVLHLGLAGMTVGLIALFFQFGGDSAPTASALAPALLAYGLGMGMIFVPLFGIIVGDLEDHEIGSASGLLESFQQGAAALGVAALGTVFFSGFAMGDGPEVALGAIRSVTGVALLLTVASFAVAFGLPRQAGTQQH